MFETNIKILTEEEIAENRRQRGLLGVKLAGSNKFSCEKKLMDTCTHFFYDHTTCGKCRIDGDGKLCIVIYTLNQPLLHEFIKRTSDEKDFHKFLNGCYERICEIHKRHTEEVQRRVQSDQDFIKYREEVIGTVEVNLREKRIDQGLLQSQKTKKPMPIFDKNNFKTWAGFDQENAQRSRDNLTPKKTGLLKKEDNLEKQIQKFTTEMAVFQKKVDELKPKLEAAKDESEYKNLRLSYDYNKLQVEKLQKKIEEAEKQKADIQNQLDALEKQIDILECIIDHYQIIKDAENWQNRRDRAVERVSKVLKDRGAIDTMRINLNQRWNDLVKLPEESHSVSPYRGSTPIKEEEICEALTLKADAQNYFL